MDLTLVVTWEEGMVWQEERYDLYAWNQASFWSNMERRRFAMVHLEEPVAVTSCRFSGPGVSTERILVWQCPIDYPPSRDCPLCEETP